MAYGYNPSYNPSVNYFGQPYAPMFNGAAPIQPTQQSMQPGPQNGPQQTITLFARCVAGREEAMAAMVTPDGSLNLFVDEQHGMIYGKAVAPNGAAVCGEVAYRQPVQQPAEPQQVQPQWAPLELVEQLRAEVRQLREMWNGRGDAE